MTLKEFISKLDRQQKIIINLGKYSQIFRGKVCQINPRTVDENREIDFIYTDQDIYSDDYIKIRLKKKE